MYQWKMFLHWWFREKANFWFNQWKFDWLRFREPICKKKWIFWPISNSLFSYKSKKNENKINLESRTEEACSMNIQSKKSAWFTKYFSCKRGLSFEKNSFDKNAFEVFSVTYHEKKSPEGTFFSQSPFGNPFSIVHRFEKCKEKFDFLERTRWKSPLNKIRQFNN